MKTKVLLGSLLLGAVLATGASAKDMEQSVYIKASTGEIFKTRATITGVGYGVKYDTVTDGVFIGGSFEAEKASFDTVSLETPNTPTGFASTSSYIGYSADFKVGKHLTDSLDIYGKVGLKAHLFNGEAENGYGYFVGAGADYKITEDFGVGVEVTQSDMSYKNEKSYDYFSYGASVKYLF